MALHAVCQETIFTEDKLIYSSHTISLPPHALISDVLSTTEFPLHQNLPFQVAKQFSSGTATLVPLIPLVQAYPCAPGWLLTLFPFTLSQEGKCFITEPQSTLCMHVRVRKCSLFKQTTVWREARGRNRHWGVCWDPPVLSMTLVGDQRHLKLV